MFNIKGYVHAVLKDAQGNVIQESEGPNTVVKMSNNILMDQIISRIYASDGVTPLAAPDRAAQLGMAADGTAYPNGPDYIGPDMATGNALDVFGRNRISFIAVGSNLNDGLGTNTVSPVNASQNTEVANSSQLTTMVDGNFNPVSVTPIYCKVINSVTFPEPNKIQFTAEFDTTEGNLADGIAEIGIWTAGDNADADCFTGGPQPATSTNMRLFARRHLTNTITKTDDGTLTITYTLTFQA
jgi:hypothetical protein